jgi:AraC-like DNA-binding protein
MDVLSDVITAARTGRPHSNRTHRQAPWTIAPDPTSAIGFHVVLEGSCRLTGNGTDPIPLGIGDVVCVLPHNKDYGLADQGTTTVLLCGAYRLDLSRPHPLLAELPEVIHLPARAGRHSALRSTIDLLTEELEQPRQGTDALVPALLDTLLLYMLRAWFDSNANSGWAAALADPAVDAALRAIHADPTHPWTVEELGTRAGLSRAAFARKFTTFVGQPPLTYVTWWRMTIAARLLRDTDAPLAGVALRAGYTSEFAFGKAFKREYGTAPGVYRRSSR